MLIQTFLFVYSFVILFIEILDKFITNIHSVNVQDLVSGLACRVNLTALLLVAM
jgi:hypothetical protein